MTGLLRYLEAFRSLLHHCGGGGLVTILVARAGTGGLLAAIAAPLCPGVTTGQSPISCALSAR